MLLLTWVEFVSNNSCLGYTMTNINCFLGLLAVCFLVSYGQTPVTGSESESEPTSDYRTGKLYSTIRFVSKHFIV